jgi:Zn-dependent M28 family amino/carboxypeptidase
MNKKLLVTAVAIGISALLIFEFGINKKGNQNFSGEKALETVKAQLDLGPRTPGSQAHEEAINLIQSGLLQNDWEVEIQQDTNGDYPIQNIIGKRGAGNSPWIIIAAHYDTRFFADQDPFFDNHTLPVPGANDGASGVAILLELARIIPDDLEKNIWLVFFDAEDQGNIENWDWILGSKSFVSQLSGKPDKVAIIDMVGDKDLNLFYEKNSNPELSKELWDIARQNGFGENFIPEYKFNMLDDHIPFISNGIPAIDIIDFDYPYWHTIDDTYDKVSAESLYAVGQTLLKWLLTS